MTEKEKIRNIIELFIAWNGETEVIDIANLDSAVDFIIDSLPEEPVSEELEEAVNAYIGYPPEVDECSSVYGKRRAFKAGAQWQKEVFEKNRLAACDRATKEEIEREQDFVDKVLIGEQRQPTFSDAIEYGIKWQKQQTIDKACEFFIEHCGYIDTASYDLDDVINNFRKALKKE